MHDKDAAVEEEDAEFDEGECKLFPKNNDKINLCSKLSQYQFLDSISV